MKKGIETLLMEKKYIIELILLWTERFVAFRRIGKNKVRVCVSIRVVRKTEVIATDLHCS